ncbi:hypothetical protein [Bremerella sp.]|uniref:hypothetical protein n=1 Tax=Bremerella sp. TaxID=2795602 RepID=UPI00391AA37D
MSSSPAHPQPSDQRSTECQPQVVVRAGKHYVCSACGTLVEIPAEVVGQLVIAVDPAPQSKSPRQADSRKEDPQTENAQPGKPQVAAAPSRRPIASLPSSGGDGRGTSASHSTQTTRRLKPARPRHPKRPPRENFAGQTIDGLIVPTGAKLDRALAWVSFHLRVLDRQGTEFDRLRKLLKKQRQKHSRAGAAHAIVAPPDNQKRPRVPRPSLLGRANGLSSGALRKKGYADVSLAPQASGILTRWHRKSVTPSYQRRVRTWKRIQGRGPP